jgi:hypothetical protein
VLLGQGLATKCVAWYRSCARALRLAAPSGALAPAIVLLFLLLLLFGPLFVLILVFVRALFIFFVIV